MVLVARIRCNIMIGIDITRAVMQHIYNRC